MGTDREARLEAALIRVRAHTAWTYPQGGDTVGLLAGLLRAIEMIVDAALSTPPEATPEPPTPDDVPLAPPGPGDTDASHWAESFVAHVRRKPSIATDEGTMIGWFANAIMAGFDAGRRQSAEPCEGTCNPHRARCGATFCTYEDCVAHERECKAPTPERVKSVLARLNASTASLKHVREGATVRDGDHISMPLPERPAERCVWTRDSTGWSRPRCTTPPHEFRDWDTRGWRACPFCARPLSVELGYRAMREER